MTETRIILYLVLGVLCWLLGGTVHKGIRRYLWPLMCIWLLPGPITFPAAQAIVLVIIGLIVVNSLPYGDSTPWWVRVLVFMSYPLPALFLSTGAWVMIPLSGVVLCVWFLLSRKVPAFTWKLWEAQAGLLQATALVLGALGR